MKTRTTTAMSTALWALCLMWVSNLMSCKEHKTKDTQAEELTVSEAPAEGSYYYASQTPSPLSDEAFNFQFIRFDLKANGHVEGVFYHIPYGTDSSRGSIKGVLNSENQLTAEKTIMAEGSVFKAPITYVLKDDSIELGYTNPDGSEASLAEVSKETYETLFKAYEQQLLKGYLNTTDRSRLLGLKRLKAAMGYTEEDMNKLQFMEAMVDLDNDPSEMEYLLYIMDPMLCGSGGCNLYLLKADGTELGQLSVTRPPIYIDSFGFEDPRYQKGRWRTLYVYSEGMRVVSPKDGAYPSNPSILKEISDVELRSFPEQYQLLMDYQDKD